MRLLNLSAFTSLLLSGAIFGFFYAWSCSTLWGLDQIDASIAIQAMQAMNASVRNALFFPAFFLTTPALIISALLCWRVRNKKATVYFSLAAACYFFGAFLVTANISVALNEALALVPNTISHEQATQVWQQYSSQWQFWNYLRTVVSAVTLLLCGAGLVNLKHK